MIGIRAANGLGDAVHLRSAVLHLINQGEDVKVFTPFPVVFSDLPIQVAPRMDGNEHEGLRHFMHPLGPSDIDAFSGSCLRAGIALPVGMKAEWQVRNVGLVERVLDAAGGKSVFVYQPLKMPHNPPQHLLRPNKKVYEDFIADHYEHFRVKLGVSAKPSYDSGPCDMNLFNKTSIEDAFDIATIGDMFFGESCFIPMVGESMDKKFTIMFTRRALSSDHEVRFMTPTRLFHKKHLATAVYDET